MKNHNVIVSFALQIVTDSIMMSFQLCKSGIIIFDIKYNQIYFKVKINPLVILYPYIILVFRAYIY